MTKLCHYGEWSVGSMSYYFKLFNFITLIFDGVIKYVIIIQPHGTNSHM